MVQSQSGVAVYDQLHLDLSQILSVYCCFAKSLSQPLGPIYLFLEALSELEQLMQFRNSFSTFRKGILSEPG
jgi:hypothetical protein